MLREGKNQTATGSAWNMGAGPLLFCGTGSHKVREVTRWRVAAKLLYGFQARAIFVSLANRDEFPGIYPKFSPTPRRPRKLFLRGKRAAVAVLVVP